LAIYGLSRVKIKAQLVSELGLENAVDKLVGDLGWKLSFSVALLHEPKLYF
jgi:hypothetical protein